MKTPIALHTAVLALVLAVPATAMAGEAKMSLQNPDKFTDIEPGNGTDKSFRKGLQRAFTAELAKSAKALPAGQTLEVTFTDIDLAGEVDPVELPGGYQLRLLKDVYFPRLQFDYRVLDAAGAVVSEQKGVELKDMSYLFGPRSSTTSTSFYYETRMLREWFNKTLPGDPK
ncbi:MAG: DUF3016 domain-containing protein [Arenimonas sp.]